MSSISSNTAITDKPSGEAAHSPHEESPVTHHAHAPGADSNAAWGHVVPTIIPLIPAGEIPPLDALLVTKLQALHRHIVKKGKRFTKLEIEQKHALRKRVKLLRYSLGFCETLLSSARLKAYRKPLGALQDILGDFNDLAVAHDSFLSRTTIAPEAWFAVGWLAARQALLVERAQTAFGELGHAPEFWKKH